MGMRAHVRTKSIVKCSCNGYFNWAMQELCDILEDRGCDTSYATDEDGNVKYYWELPIDGVKVAIAKLKEENSDTDIIGNYTAKDVAEILEEWVATVEEHPENYSNTTYIHLDWY